jgi:hypothetical protein
MGRIVASTQFNPKYYASLVIALQSRGITENSRMTFSGHSLNVSFPSLPVHRNISSYFRVPPIQVDGSLETNIHNLSSKARGNPIQDPLYSVPEVLRVRRYRKCEKVLAKEGLLAVLAAILQSIFTINFLQK